MGFKITKINLNVDLSKYKYKTTDPSEVLDIYLLLCDKYGPEHFKIFKDGEEISCEELKREDIFDNFERDPKLKFGYRPGYGSNTDIAEDSYGDPKNVWKPCNPESDFD